MVNVGSLPSSNGRRGRLHHNQPQSDDVPENANVDTNDRRASFSSKHSSGFDDEEKAPPPPRRSASLLDALSDSNSALAKFLLTGAESEEDRGLFDDILSPVFDNPMMKSMRNMATRFITGEDEVHTATSLGTSKAWFYSLALESMEVRSERIVMLAEAYAM